MYKSPGTPQALAGTLAPHSHPFSAIEWVVSNKRTYFPHPGEHAASYRGNWLDTKPLPELTNITENSPGAHKPLRIFHPCVCQSTSGSSFTFSTCKPSCDNKPHLLVPVHNHLLTGSHVQGSNERWRRSKAVPRCGLNLLLSACEVSSKQLACTFFNFPPSPSLSSLHLV